MMVLIKTGIFSFLKNKYPAFCVSIYLILILTALTSSAQAQTLHPLSSDSVQKSSQLISYPIVFFLPETNWALGAAGIYTFRFKSEPKTSNPSQWQFLAAYTFNRQLLLALPFELYKKNNTWKIKGEVAYYRYVYNFYGVGIQSALQDREKFTIQYPRFRIDFQKNVGSSFVGLRYRMDNHKMIQKGPLLNLGNHTGSDGGFYSGLGIIYQWDTRDVLYNPSSGSFIQVESFFNTRYFGSDFEYQRFSLDAAKFFRLGPTGICALNMVVGTMSGDVPFYDMMYFGRPTQMRGYQDRRFIDKNLFILQAEYRLPLFWRIEGVGFMATGTVGQQFSDIFGHPYKFTYGAGLRLVVNKKDQVKLRIDYGRTINEGGAFYLTSNEAF